jgi:hypothetical protein
MVRFNRFFFGSCLTSCIDDSPVDPTHSGDLLTPTPSATVVDGSTTGTDEFYFLPPLVKNSSVVGVFNPHLLPTMRICEVVDGDCVEGESVAFFAEGSAEVGDDMYQISWDTDGPETGDIDPNKTYRMEIAVAGTVMGSIDLDPQDPDGPGQSTSDDYAFRLGETIPVKFWLSTEVLCEGEDYVLECITGAVLDELGGTLQLDDFGDRLSVELPPSGLPGENHPPITVVIERLDPTLFLGQEGVECIPFFDAPQFGPCFRITTYPELTEPLDWPALISICIEPDSIPAIRVLEAQQEQLQIVRFATDGSGTIEALQNVAGDCDPPEPTASLLTVPEAGPFRYAALGLNALARMVGPQPLAAHGSIRLGGLTSSFSRFRFALPGVMSVTDGNDEVLQDGDPNQVLTEITVVDEEGVPVQNALVHFSTTDGTLSVPQDSTDADGHAYVTWAVDVATPGTKTLTASAKGLVEGTLPDHQTSFVFALDDVTATATVVGPPSAIAPDPTDTLSGTAGESAGTVSITVTDEGSNPVIGAEVTWTPSGDGSTTGGATTTTDSNGTASTEWTLPTKAGESTLTVTVDDLTHTFAATASAGAIVQPSASEVSPSGTVGEVVGVLEITVADQYGNPYVGYEVVWVGDGVESTTTLTDISGVATLTWTLGTAAGLQTVTASGEDFEDISFTTEALAADPVQPEASVISPSGTVGTEFGDILEITVADQYGNPYVGYEVVWVGDGVESTTTLTDSFGVAQLTWTLGTVAGLQTVTASGADFEDISFTTEALPDAAHHFVLVSGDGQQGYVGATLAPLSARLEDQYNNVILVETGEGMGWDSSPGSTIVGAAFTNAEGLVTADWTLGATPGPYTAKVTFDGVEQGFTAEAICFDGFGVADVDGTFDAAEWACARADTLVANLSGGDTEAHVYWMNSADSLYLAVRVLQSSFDRVNSLLVDFDNDGNPDTPIEADYDVIGYDADNETFFDRHITQSCLNRSQSGCGEDDVQRDGGGDAANNGEWTTYELSHPLNNGDSKDIAVSAGQSLGFFLTLRVGKGAQGNTQWPGFRVFRYIDIVGF